MSTTLTIVDVLRSDLTRPISCTAANKLETEKSAPFNLTVYCKYCTTRVAAPEDLKGQTETWTQFLYDASATPAGQRSRMNQLLTLPQLVCPRRFVSL